MAGWAERGEMVERAYLEERIGIVHANTLVTSCEYELSGSAGYEVSRSKDRTGKQYGNLRTGVMGSTFWSSLGIELQPSV